MCSTGGMGIPPSDHLHVIFPMKMTELFFIVYAGILTRESCDFKKKKSRIQGCVQQAWSKREC